MNFLRKKSTAHATKHISELLADVQECCSRDQQTSLDPSMESVNKTVVKLLQTVDREDLDQTIKFLANELKSESHQTIMLALGTLGYLMNNDCPEFQSMVLQSSLISKQMLRLAEQQKKPSGRQDHVEEAKRALTLIQSWGEGFRRRPDAREFIELHRSLKKKEWVMWPSKDSRFEIVSASDDLGVDEAKGRTRPPRNSPRNASTAISGDRAWLQKDFDQFESSLDMLEAELSSAHDAEEVKANELIPELVQNCEKIGPQLRSMIEIVSATANNQECLIPLLEMNDRLIRLMNNYKKLLETLAEAINPFEAAKPYNPFETAAAAYNPFEDESLLLQVLGSIPASEGPNEQAVQNFPKPARRPPAVPPPTFNNPMPAQLSTGPFDEDDLL